MKASVLKWGAGLLTAAGASGTAWWFDRLWMVQWALLAVGLLWVAYRLAPALDLLTQFVAGNPVTAGLIAVFYGLMVGWIQADKGIVHLFWHEDVATRLSASFFTALFFGLLFIVAFYADPDRARTRMRLVRLLNAYPVPRLLAARVWWSVARGLRNVAAWFRRRGWAGQAPPRPPARRPARAVPVHDDLTRFLKVFLYPFWLLLLLPAVAPSAFDQVPNSLPIKLAGKDIGLIASAANDATRNLPVWLAGVALWGAGLLAGLSVLMVYIGVNRRIFGPLPPSSPGSPIPRPGHRTARTAFDGLVGLVCPMPDADPASAVVAAKDDVQAAVVRFTTSLFLLYLLAVAAHWVFGRRDDRLVNAASASGVIVLGAACWGMIRFLHEYSGPLRRDFRRDAHRGRFRRVHFGLFATMGLGIALGGMSLALFPVFLLVALLSIVNIIIAKLSNTWNWPIRWIPMRLILTAALVLWLVWANGSWSKLRVPGLEADYAAAARTPDRELYRLLDARKRGAVQNDREVLEDWEATVKRDRPPSYRPKLAILAVSGGASRAAFWTAKVIEVLDRDLPGFPAHLRLITGASGGMVGAAHYVVALNGGPNARDDGWLVNQIETDSLSPVVRQWMLGDVPFSFVPVDVSTAWDRGVALERTWPALAEVSFDDLKSRELAGEIPSLLFSPMLVEDGRQLLISNLNLAFLSHAGGAMLTQSKRPDGLPLPPPEVYSYPAVELFRAFPGHEARFSVATAVRLSASFPYVSPAVYLPTLPERRVVDAGYYDNFGISTAAAWIFEHRHWLRDHTGGVVLVQVRAYPNQVGRTTPQGEEGGPLGRFSRAFQFLTSPGEGGITSRGATTLFRNDQVIHALSEWFRDQKAPGADGAPPTPLRPDFFTTALFEYGLDGPLNWYTTEQERQLVLKSFAQGDERDRLLESLVSDPKEVSRLVNMFIQNAETREKLKAWWGRP